jgi:hypothetical protein
VDVVAGVAVAGVAAAVQPQAERVEQQVVLAAGVVVEVRVATPPPIRFHSFEDLPLNHGFRFNHGPPRSTITTRPMR